MSERRYYFTTFDGLGIVSLQRDGSRPFANVHDILSAHAILKSFERHLSGTVSRIARERASELRAALADAEAIRATNPASPTPPREPREPVRAETAGPASSTGSVVLGRRA